MHVKRDRGDCKDASTARSARTMVLLVMFGTAISNSAAVVADDSITVDNVKHVTVYHEPGRFGGWPANHGIWNWGNEILTGFSRGFHKDLGPDRHAIDRDKPEDH